jgi:hypothetical protein
MPAPFMSGDKGFTSSDGSWSWGDGRHPVTSPSGGDRLCLPFAAGWRRVHPDQCRHRVTTTRAPVLSPVGDVAEWRQPSSVATR